MINFDKITDIFCIVDEFCIEFEKFTQPFLLGNPPKKKPKMSNSEIMTIITCFNLVVSGLLNTFTFIMYRNICKKIFHKPYPTTDLQNSCNPT